MFRYFACACSDALFQMMDGEKDRVATYLRHCRRVPVGGIERVKRPTWRKLARYVCPAPQVIVEKLLSIAFFWSGVVVPETGQAFFTSNWKQLFKKEVAYVQAGYLSDPPHLPQMMYRVPKTCSLWVRLHILFLYSWYVGPRRLP